MDLVAGVAGGLMNALLHTKGKLVKLEPGGGGSSGLLGKLGAAAASMSPIPIPGLGAKDPDNEISFMFNPTEYKLSRDVELSNPRNPGIVGGMPEFLGTGGLKLSMQLFFDDFASAKGDVTPKINKLFSWQVPNKDSSVQTWSPPLVKFAWGENGVLNGFQGILTDVSASYTMFNRSGTPIQATVDITIVQANGIPVPKWPDPPGTNPTSHALDARRVHVVVEGDTLASIAYSEYGDPGYWRALAEVNGIDDPLRVRPGANLVIPGAADAARLA
jgi:hypothetical protein